MNIVGWAIVLGLIFGIVVASTFGAWWLAALIGFAGIALGIFIVVNLHHEKMLQKLVEGD